MTLLEFYRRLVQSRSTPGTEADAIALAAQEMTDLGYDEVTVDSHGNLVGRIGEPGGPVLLVDGHVDTIPLYAENEWTHDPLGAEVVDGRVYGLGTSDMKGAVAASVHGGARLKDAASQLGGCLLVSVSIAEEMLEGATLAGTFEGQRIDWCVIGEPTYLRVATAQRGRCRVEVELHGRLSHAASSERGVNAAANAARLVTKLDGVEHPTHPLLGKRSINLIDIHSEPNPSISTIPNYCLAHFDVRFMPQETRESILDVFRSLLPAEGSADVRFATTRFTTYVGEDYARDDFAAAWETARSEPIVTGALTATGGEAWAYQFCTNGSYFAGARAIPTVGYGPGDPTLAHSVDENVEISQLERAADGYLQIAATLLKQ